MFYKDVLKIIVLVSFIYVVLFCFFPQYWDIEPFNNKEEEEDEDEDVDLRILGNSWSVDQNKYDVSKYRGKVDIVGSKQKCLPWKSIAKDGVWPDYLNTEEKRINKLGDKDGDHNYCRNPFWDRERKSSEPNYLSCPVEKEVDGKTSTLDGSIFEQCNSEALKKEVTDNKCIAVNSWWKGKAIIENDDKKDDGNNLEKTKSHIIVSSWQACHKKCKDSLEKLSPLDKKKGLKPRRNCKAFTTKIDSDCLNNGICKCYLFEDGSFNRKGTSNILLDVVSTEKIQQEKTEQVKDYVSFDNECLTEKRLYSDISAKIHPGFKKCTCNAGKPAERDNCPGDGIEKCEICNSGYSKHKDNPDLCVKDDDITKEEAEEMISDSLPESTLLEKTTIRNDSKRKQLERFIPSCSQCTQYDYLKDTIPHPDGVDCRAGGKGLVKEKKLKGIKDKKDTFLQEIYRIVLNILCILNIWCEDKDCPQK